MTTFGFTPDDTAQEKIPKLKAKFGEFPLAEERIDKCILVGKLRDEKYVKVRSFIRTQPHDTRFLTYNANQVGKTRYIAAEGPTVPVVNIYKDANSVARFLCNTLFHETQPAKVFLRLGKAWGPAGKLKGGDFFDYATVHKECACFDLDDPLNPDKLKKEKYEITNSKLTYGKQKLFLNSNDVLREEPVTTEVTVVDRDSKTEQTMTVYDYPIHDGTSLELTWLRDPNDHRQWLYEIYKKSENEDVLVHCASGVGRTNTIILAFLVLDYFDNVFVDDIAKTNNNIEDLIMYLAMHRYLFISYDQKKSAIEMAVYLREYELSLDNDARKDRSKLAVSFEEIQQTVQTAEQQIGTKLCTKKGTSFKTFTQASQPKESTTESTNENKVDDKRRQLKRLRGSDTPCPPSVASTLFHKSAKIQNEKEKVPEAVPLPRGEEDDGPTTPLLERSDSWPTGDIQSYS